MSLHRFALSERITASLPKIPKVALLALATFGFAGCGTVNHVIYKTTGGVVKSYANDHAMPYLLESKDLAMACAMAEATAPLMMSFGRVTSEPDQLGVMLNLSAGGCEDERAWDNELAYLRAIGEQNGRAAQDAQIAQKRHQRRAAERYLRSWEHLTAHYGDPGEGECPSFDSSQDEFIYMAGLLSGLQALNNEIQSSVSVGVPKNVGSKVSRATQCLDDDKWWGAPSAIRATVWAMIPGAEPDGKDPFQYLERADRKGEQAGVRIAHVFHAMAASNAGDTEKVKAIIKAHAESLSNTPSNEEWRMVDEMATRNLLAISDRLWTQNQGHRTPIGGLGTFWDDEQSESFGEDLDLEGIL